MNNPVLKFKKTHADAVLPKANNDKPFYGDTGYDLTSVESAHIQPGTSRVVDVGLTLADITPGYWFKIEPRSGLGFKSSIQPHLGVIDNGYRGDLGVKLYNFHETEELQVNPGDRIAQIVVYPLIQPDCEWSEVVSETDRGDKGFGSSDGNLGLPPLSKRIRDISKYPNDCEPQLTADMEDIKEKVLRIKPTDDWWAYADALTREKIDSGEYIPNPMKLDAGDPDLIPNPDRKK